MKQLVAIILVSLAAGTIARAEGPRGFFSLGADAVLEYAADGRTLEARVPYSLRGGARWELLDAYLEVSHFATEDGASFVGVRREHTEWLAWARHFFFAERALAPYAALGGGFQFDDVTTTFQGVSATERGTPFLEAAGAFGGRYLVSDHLSIEAEARVAFSRGFAPEPVPGAGIYLTWLF